MSDTRNEMKVDQIRTNLNNKLPITKEQQEAWLQFIREEIAAYVHEETALVGRITSQNKQIKDLFVSLNSSNNNVNEKIEKLNKMNQIIANTNFNALIPLSNKVDILQEDVNNISRLDLDPALNSEFNVTIEAFNKGRDAIKGLSIKLPKMKLYYDEQVEKMSKEIEEELKLSQVAGSEKKPVPEIVIPSTPASKPAEKSPVTARPSSDGLYGSSKTKAVTKSKENNKKDKSSNKKGPGCNIF